MQMEIERLQEIDIDRAVFDVYPPLRSWVKLPVVAAKRSRR